MNMSGTFHLMYYIAVMVLTGVTIALIDIPFLQYLQKTVSGEFRGRVLSIGLSIIKLVLPFALILSGVLIDVVSTWALVVSGGIMMIFVGLLGMKSAPEAVSEEYA